MSGYHSAASTAPSSSLVMTAPLRDTLDDVFDATPWGRFGQFDGFGGTNSTTADGFVAETQRLDALNINQYQPLAPDGATLVMGTSPWDSLVPGEPLSSQTPFLRHESATPPIGTFAVDASLPPRSEYLPPCVSLPLVFPPFPTPFDPFPLVQKFPVLSTSPDPFPPQDQRQYGTHQEATAPHGKMAIDRTTYKPQREGKIKCRDCNESPDGFFGPYELHRHQKRRHAPRRLMWVCQDPHNDTPKGCRPIRRLEICKKCRDHKTYNAPYNAAEHLRREHFTPKKGGRRVSGLHRSGYGPKAAAAGGFRPSMKWLTSHGWVVEIEVVNDAVTSPDGTVTATSPDDTVTATTDYMRTGMDTRMDTGPESMTTAATPQTASTPWVDSDPTTPPCDSADEADMAGMGVWMEPEGS